MLFYRDLTPDKIIAVDLYLEKKVSKIYVGRLEMIKKHYVFTYDLKYLYTKNIIPLGPEHPLTQQKYKSKILFPFFVDRIPERANPAYPDYCNMQGITVDETDDLVRLTTIGRRGPSSFILSPVFSIKTTACELKNFRTKLNLTVREFASVFDMSPAIVTKIENGNSSGKDILKRVEIYLKFPEVALYEITRNGGAINDFKRQDIVKLLKKQL